MQFYKSCKTFILVYFQQRTNYWKLMIANMQQILTLNQSRYGTMLMYVKMPTCFGGCTTQLQSKDTLLDLLSYGCRFVHSRCWKLDITPLLIFKVQ